MSKLFVGNLSWDASEEELKLLFDKHGRVVSVRIVQDPYTGRSKGFGFVEMESEEACENVIRALNDADFMGRPLRVSRARQENERGERRSSGGGYRGNGGGGGEGRPPRKPFRPRYEESQYS